MELSSLSVVVTAGRISQRRQKEETLHTFYQFSIIKVLNDCRVYNYINSVPSIEFFTTSTARQSERKNKSQEDESQEKEQIVTSQEPRAKRAESRFIYSQDGVTSSRDPARGRGVLLTY